MYEFIKKVNTKHICAQALEPYYCIKETEYKFHDFFDIKRLVPAVLINVAALAANPSTYVYTGVSKFFHGSVHIQYTVRIKYKLI